MIADRVLQRVEGLMNVLASILLVAMMLLGTADVLGRYIFSHPLLGVRELSANYFMVGVVWLSIAHTERLEGHIGVDIVANQLSKTIRTWLLAIGRLVAVVPIALIANETFHEMVDSFGQKTQGSLELYTSPSWAMVFFGSGLLAVTLCTRSALDIINLLRGKRPWS